MLTHRVEWETGYVVFEGTLASCTRFISDHPHPEELILVSLETGRAVSWVASLGY